LNIDFFKEQKISPRDMEKSEFVEDFITELTEYLNDFKEKVINDRKEERLNNLREEGCLYQVVDLSSKGVYLQNTKNNIIFEETNIPKELKNILSKDFILSYKQGAYIFEEDLTDIFYKNMVDIKKEWYNV